MRFAAGQPPAILAFEVEEIAEVGMPGSPRWALNVARTLPSPFAARRRKSSVAWLTSNCIRRHTVREQPQSIARAGLRATRRNRRRRAARASTPIRDRQTTSAHMDHIAENARKLDPTRRRSCEFANYVVVDAKKCIACLIEQQGIAIRSAGKSNSQRVEEGKLDCICIGTTSN